MEARQHVVDDRVFRRARLVGSVRIAVMEARTDVADAVDVLAGVKAEMTHLARQADNLAEQPAYDTGERDRLLAQRAELRRRERDAEDQVWRAQLAALAAATANPPDVDWCLEHISPDDLEAIYRAWDPDEDGAVPPSEATSTGTQS